MKVFISSTSLDLALHRKAVAEAVERLGIQLSRMESFGARPKEPSRACLDEVKESDLFVGIYAHRYGFIPKGSKRSITEAEFDRATELRRPTFCFLVDPDFPWDESFKERGPSAGLLTAFKSRVNDLVVRDMFTTPEVLATRVATALGRYLIADPRRSGASSVDQFARGALADGAAAVFVDIMRLASVAASPVTRRANRRRHGEFIAIADEHLSNFRSQIARLVGGSDDSLLTRCADVEIRLAWAINRLRHSPKLDTPWREFAPVLSKLAGDVHKLALTASSKYYRKRIAEIFAVTKDAGRRRHMLLDPDAYSARSSELQSKVINLLRETAAIAIATVADDMDRVLAIPYFTIERELLCAAVAAQK